MKRVIKIKLLLGIAICMLSVSTTAEIKVTHMFCDEKVNPIGVYPKDLTFSWIWKSNRENDLQQYYRVVVSSNLHNIESGSYDIWDSGRVKSGNNIQIDFAGKKLKGNKKYYWKVMFWNTIGEKSTWSSISTFVTALIDEYEWMDAKWIGYEDLPDEWRVVPGMHTHENRDSIFIKKDAIVPYLRKKFSLEKEVKEAYLSISGLGHYESYINGEKISSDFLSPGWTYYDKQVLFNTYDVTNYLKSGDNLIAAIVGNGFHYINHKRYLKLGIAFGYPKFICNLKVIYTDGSEKNIVSNSSWKTDLSPIIYSSIYGGEDYDARKERKGWNHTGYDDKDWRNAVEVSLPGGNLEPETTYPLEVLNSLDAQKIHKINNSCYTWDFGQNASGIVEIKLKGKKGQKIKIWPGELLSKDNKVNQKASGTPYYFEYTLNGDSVECWQPKFTYYGFRYVMIEGANPIGSENHKHDFPEVTSLKLLHVSNSAPRVGNFKCSSELMNQIFELINWAIKSNMQSVLTDCPHREKLGWLEQSYLMGNSIRYNYSTYHLYRKKIRDMIYAQRDDGLIPDIAPEYVVFSDGFLDSPEWGSAGVILPYLLYRWYGDKSILDEAYPMMKKYVDYLTTKSNNHILSHGLGDWFDYGANPPGVSQLTPIALTATATYYYDVKLLTQIALILDKNQEMKTYLDLSDKIKKAFNAKFYDPINNSYATGSQTALAMPLCVGLVNDADKEGVYSSLMSTIEKDGFALTAGDIGFHYLVEALSAEQEYAEILYKMINRQDVPGYGFQLAKGATALTESWPALEEVSNNHLMLGHIMEWFYTCILGIRDTADAVASDKLILRPMPIGDIEWASGSYMSPRGLIRIKWEKHKEEFKLICSIPDGVKAKIILPEGYTKASKGNTFFPAKNVKYINNQVEIDTIGGDYNLSYSLKTVN